ncbi:nucleotidyl transferase AbiEii/AbiGii toxin family protein [Amnibacterium endophyticum]|uniref:Nucleotidyl transferase AbiEii/AbiGii toxin family protein n=1 Tax=Amnibacterium endophyticum TaxID=2109337 RepID=A0ABW4LJP5_9MICO
MTPDRPQTLTRADLITGLRELLAELRTAGTGARIRIVGGAAIALTLQAERPATVDIDGPLEPAAPVLDAARRVAGRHGWRTDWINDAAAAFIPTGYGDRTAEWTTVYDDHQVLVQIASPETLLAMKLHAAQRRGNRDARDLAVLLPHCGIATTDDAEQLYEDYYPGDALTPRTLQLVDQILAAAPTTPSTPPPPDLS